MENQRVRLSKKLLKNSLIELLLEKPIEKISVKEICEKAELNRSTFYLHYTDQFDLLKDIENDVIIQTGECLKDVKRDASTKTYIATFLRNIRDNKDIFKALLSIEDFQQFFIENSLEYTKAGIGLNESNSTKESLIYAFLLNGSLAMIKNWLDSDFSIDENELADLIYRLSDNAIR